MSAAFQHHTSLRIKTTTCITCGITICLPADYYDKRLADQIDYYCPNGHPQHFIGKTEAQRLREQLDRERKRREWAEQAAENERRSARAVRGHNTRLKKRASAGVCPCCQRSFQNLRRHMKCKHPGFAKEEP